MPNLGNVVVKHICPSCQRKVERQIPYIKGDLGKTRLEAHGWCRGLYCEAKHNIIYSIRQIGDYFPKIKVHNFTCNGEVFRKHFLISEWSEMRKAKKSATKKKRKRKKKK